MNDFANREQTQISYCWRYHGSARLGMVG